MDLWDVQCDFWQSGEQYWVVICKVTSDQVTGRIAVWKNVRSHRTCEIWRQQGFPLRRIGRKDGIPVASVRGGGQMGE